MLAFTIEERSHRLSKAPSVAQYCIACLVMAIVYNIMSESPLYSPSPACHAMPNGVCNLLGPRIQWNLFSNGYCMYKQVSSLYKSQKHESFSKIMPCMEPVYSGKNVGVYMHGGAESPQDI